MAKKQTTQTKAAKTKQVPVVSAPEAGQDLPPLDVFNETPSAPLLSEPKTKVGVKVKQQNSSATAEMPVGPTADPRAGLPDDYDDPQTTAAIEDIVAHEGDESLSAQDRDLASRRARVTTPVKQKKGHPIFWGIVALICLIAIAYAVFFVDPSLHNPLSKIHWRSSWKSLRRHF